MEAHIPNFKQHQLPSTTHIDFYQAMQDFRTMFPTMDDDVIEEVLRANQGAVDLTIDQLLAMSTDNFNETLRHDLEKSDDVDGDRKYNGVTLCDPSDVTKCETNQDTNVVVPKKWSPPLLGQLPSTFLRIGPTCQKPFVDCCEDERIALFLQNEEFLSELRMNQDFLSTLDQDTGVKDCAASDTEVFKERLRNMGKMSRNKFAQLSRIFQRRKKNRSAKSILEENVSGDVMLLSGEPLISEGQEDLIRKG